MHLLLFPIPFEECTNFVFCCSFLLSADHFSILNLLFFLHSLEFFHSFFTSSLPVPLSLPFQSSKFSYFCHLICFSFPTSSLNQERGVLMIYQFLLLTSYFPPLIFLSFLPTFWFFISLDLYYHLPSPLPS